MTSCWPKRRNLNLKSTDSNREAGAKLVSMSASVSYGRKLDLRKSLEGHEGAVLYCAVDQKDKILATCSDDGKIKLWTIATEEIELLRTLKGGHTGEITSCAFCSIGPILASSSRDKKVILWHHDTGKRASRLELHSDAVLHCAFSKDGKFLASASRDKTARLYKISPGAGEFVPGGDVQQLVGHTAAVNFIQFSPDGAVVFTCSDDRTIRTWRRDNDWNCGTTLSGREFTGPVKNVVFSPVDPVFATLAGNRVTVWMMHGNSYDAKYRVDIRSTDKQLKAISFVPDGRHIVGVADDATINIWDSIESDPLDGSWKTWCNKKSKQDQQQQQQQQKIEILSCCFSGKTRFISADSKGVIDVWELICE